MTRPSLPPDRLAAFVDGELTPEEAAEVVRHLAAHPQDQALVDDLMAANLALQRAFSAPLAEPVPPAILAAIQGTTVVPFRRRGVPIWVAGLGAALAAVAAALAVVAILPAAAPAPGGLAVGPVAPGSALDRVLTASATGAELALPDGSRLSVLASLPAEGGFCREVERLAPGVSEVALACTQGQGWTVDVVLAEGVIPTPDGFAPAGAEASGALGPWLDRRGAGQVLSPQAEAEALARGWR